MFTVIRPRHNDDIKACVEMYLKQNDDTFLPADYKASYHELSRLVRRNKFVRMALQDGELIGWIYGECGFIPHMVEPVMQQRYYTSKESGIKAVRVLYELHNALYEEGCRIGVSYVISMGSHMDEDNIMTRLLERDGWKRRGHTAMKKVTNPNPTTNCG